MIQKNTMSGILSLVLKDLPSLHRAYMPFVQGGGLFLPTKQKFTLGDEVFIRLTLMEEVEQIPVPSRVIWITPVGAHSGQTPGVGVQVLDENSIVRGRIETYLASSTFSDKPNLTM